MDFGKLSRNLKGTVRTVTEDLSDLAWATFRPQSPTLEDWEERILAELSEKGYTVVEDYWPRRRVESVKARLEETVDEIGEDKDFESGAYLRVKKDGDYDVGVCRIWHVDKYDADLKRFRYDPWVLKMAQAYYKIPFYSGMLIYQKNLPTTETTRYYHVDSWEKEFKAFMYLDDIDEEGGPFTYLAGSHRNHYLRLKKQVFGNKDGPQTSFYDEDLGDLLSGESKLCGTAGSLILANTRGLHRGSPQIGCSRSVLVNYIYKHPEEVFTLQK